MDEYEGRRGGQGLRDLRGRQESGSLKGKGKMPNVELGIHTGEGLEVFVIMAT